MKPLSKTSDRVRGQPMFVLKKRIADMESKGKRVIHFEIGDTRFPTPDCVIRETIRSLAFGETHYVASDGLAELKYTIASVTEREYGFNPVSDQILVAPANSIIDTLTRCICNEGDEAIVTDPCFPTYTSALRQNGVAVKTVRLDANYGFTLFADSVEEAITDKTKMVIVNFPNNPTGGVMERGEKNRLVELCGENGIWLLSDEVYFGMTYECADMTPCDYSGCRDGVIVLRSFSKSFAMAGFRIGYAIGNVELMAKAGLLFQSVYSCMPAFTQRGAITALWNSVEIRRGHLAYLNERRDAMCDGLNGIAGILCPVPNGAFYVFPDVSRTGMNGKEFAERLLDEYGVAVLPGIDFGPSFVNHVRLCYATDLSEIAEGVARIRRFVCK